jgi:hypothetical protein
MNVHRLEADSRPPGVQHETEVRDADTVGAKDGADCDQLAIRVERLHCACRRVIDTAAPDLVSILMRSTSRRLWVNHDLKERFSPRTRGVENLGVNISLWGGLSSYYYVPA